MKKLSAENRILGLIIFFILISVLIWGRFFFLTVIRHEYYLARASSVAIDPGIAGRGSIYLADKDNLPYAVALNREFSLLYAVPRKIKEPDILAAKLAPILEIDEVVLLEKLSKPDDPYEVLKKKISDELVTRIKALGEEGLGMEQETLRYYPAPGLLDHLLGFFGFDRTGFAAGQYGLEEYYNDRLRRGILGSKGDDLVLTVDLAIQSQISDLISQAVGKWHAASGSIIVMDPKSGRILAMASYPGFDANNYSSFTDQGVFVNSVTQKLFEPGSVFKPITMSIGIDSGAVTPDTQYFDSGEVRIGSYLIKNSTEKSYGFQTMTQVLEKSLNTGAVFVQQKVPKDVFLKYLEDFELDKKSGIDLPETKGNIANLNTGRGINYATASFGQGIAFTPINFLRAINTIANGGKLIRPYVVEKIIDSDNRITEVRSDNGKQVITPETAAKIIGMMIKVVESGSGRLAQISGYSIAGKTGTAQVPNIGSPGYSDMTIHSFVGFAPAYNPRFIALIKIDEPQDIRFAESTAAPVFRDLAQFIFSYWQIPPDKPTGATSDK